MFTRLLLAAAPLLCLSTATIAAPKAADVDRKDLRRHIDILASDAFEGREPGTAGETKTIAYLAKAMAAAGLEPAAGNGWYQQVGVVIRKPYGHRASFSAGGKTLEFEQENAVFLGRQPVERIESAPVFFVGHGAVLKDRGIDQLAGVNLKGAVALILYDSPRVAGFPSYAERLRAVTAAGAAAAIAIIGDDIPWSAVTGNYAAGQNKLRSEPVIRVQGSIPVAAAARLVAESGGDLAKLMNERGPSFRAVPLQARASLEISTQVRDFNTHNVVGRLRGNGRTGESLLFLSHWDHLGVCRPQGTPDRICNGAVDNASGLAMMLEAARHLSKGPKPKRDILFMATTAEELGLLGAQQYAAEPTVPLKSIVAAINIDTVAIAGKGEPVAIVGRGMTPIDPIVDETARELGRAVDSDQEANPFLQRQDGWALTRAGVPAVMVGGSFADMAKLNAFLGSAYHRPEDDLSRPIELGGAAEDTELLIALGRKLSDPNIYRPPAR